MKFRAVSAETKVNYYLWCVKKEISKENKYLQSLPYDPQPIIDTVKSHMDRWDPIGLLAMDCPPDEYDGESRTIAIYITKHLEDINADSLGEWISQVCKDAFGKEFTRSLESARIANDIIASLQQRSS